MDCFDSEGMKNDDLLFFVRNNRLISIRICWMNERSETGKIEFKTHQEL